MSDPVISMQKRKTQLISTFFGISLVFGIFLGLAFPAMFESQSLEQTLELSRQGGVGVALQAYQLVWLLLCFVWLSLDSYELDIRRPWWLNVGIVLLSPVFVPYYLYKTRAEGRRLPAILGFFGIVFGSSVVSAIGMLMALTMFGAAPVASASL